MRLPGRHVVARPDLVLARARGIEVRVQFARRLAGTFGRVTSAAWAPCEPGKTAAIFLLNIVFFR